MHAPTDVQVSLGADMHQPPQFEKSGSNGNHSELLA